MENSFLSFKILKNITESCLEDAKTLKKAVYCEDIIAKFLVTNKLPRKLKKYANNIQSLVSYLNVMISKHPANESNQFKYHSDVESFLQIFKMLEDVINYIPNDEVIYYTFLLNSYYSSNNEIRKAFNEFDLGDKFIKELQNLIDNAEMNINENMLSDDIDSLYPKILNELNTQNPNIKIKIFDDITDVDNSMNSLYHTLMGGSKSKVSDIETYCTNMNEEVKKKSWSKIIGRDEELKKLQQILLRKDKPNAILIGQPGIGKTKIVQGLAELINKKMVQKSLAHYVIYELNLLSLISGTSLRGQFEERINNIIKDIKDKGNIILYIDEIHMIKKENGGADNFDLASALKPLLTTGSIRVIGSTTNEEYTSTFGKDKALQRRFQNIYVEEPSKEETLSILKGIKHKYENYHKVKYSINILKLIIDLSDRYMSDKSFPDKAIDLLDSIGAYCLLKKDKDNLESYKINETDVYTVLSDVLKIKVSNLSKSEQDRLKNLVNDLNASIIGQENAIEKITNGVIISKSGLRERNKTALTLFLKGKTGIGKTFCIQKLAELLNIPLFRYDMSEFMEEHSVSKLIGSPPGYKGYEDGRAGSGLLINQIKSNPTCIILFDEIEKAHPKVQNIFLQLMDNGKLTSSSGIEADFSNAFIFMTSNIGANQSHKMKHIGFGSNTDENASDTFFDESFSPEFRNRLDGTITFNDLTDEVLNKITDNTLIELKTLLESKKVKTSYNKDVVDYIAQKAKEENLGARPIKRIIHNEIKNIISKELVYGKLVNGGKLSISVKDKELKFSY